MAEVGKEQAGLGPLRGGATEWHLQRYGRFMPLGTGEPPGPGLETGPDSSPTWKVFDSSEESGYLVLTIVISGHFFISQGQTLLEGFSLIGSKNWLKIVRRMDCLLFGTTIKSKSRMFRVQFGGASKEEALEHCRSCVQHLAQYIPVQLRQHPEQQQCSPAGTAASGGRTSVTCLAQSLLASKELPLVYEQSVWNAEEIGPFLRLCLMDQSFPAFVEDVEKNLKKLAGLRN
ncbi:meiotic recombination protein REC114 isoform X3 [Manis pentadactyla]|uniref:meiotic recombination protein REC114 isoform X3 n=1 Tax=Manis pentadactyla TaxID=143292 RepID=UPI00255CA304|nr:meiotic recombination protein REC114 isoform X3 [Manis pentadactyla]